MKISVKARTINGDQESWVVDYTPSGGKRKRIFFGKKADAEAERKRLVDQQEKAGSIFLSMSTDQRNELIQLNKEAAELGFTLREAFEFYKLHRNVPVRVRLGAAKNQFLAEKKTHVAKKTLAAFRSNVGRFVQGREEVLLSVITREDILSWLKTNAPEFVTFNTYLTSLKTFFSWCEDTGKLSKSPASSILKIPDKQMPNFDKPPVVLTVEECKSLVKATLETDPNFLPYIAVALFAGLRPEEESGKLTWDDIKDDLLRVKGRSAKSRQRRDVPINDTLKAWLALGGDLPIKNRRRRFEAVRLKAGLIQRVVVDGKEQLVGWTQDCMRHTFASNYLAVHGAEQTIKALGHGDYDMLFKHYRDLINMNEVKKFWSILPSNIDQAPEDKQPSREPLHPKLSDCDFDFVLSKE